MVATPAAERPGPLRSLWGAWSVITRDPLGVLVPTMGIGWAQLAVLVWMRQLFVEQGLLVGSASLLVGWSALSVLTAPLRTVALHRAAVASGRASAGPGRWGAMAGVMLVSGLLDVGVALLSVGVAAGLAWAALAYGWFTLGALSAALVLGLGALVAFALRVALAWAPVEVVLAGRSGSRALVASLTRGQVLHSLVAVAGGGLVAGLGALICLAGALPGAPLCDVALLVAWSDE
jgi:hypothetical protein